jgi:hypothetical protein
MNDFKVKGGGLSGFGVQGGKLDFEDNSGRQNKLFSIFFRCLGNELGGLSEEAHEEKLL